MRDRTFFLCMEIGPPSVSFCPVRLSVDPRPLVASREELHHPLHTRCCERRRAPQLNLQVFSSAVPLREQFEIDLTEAAHVGRRPPRTQELAAGCDVVGKQRRSVFSRTGTTDS